MVSEQPSGGDGQNVLGSVGAYLTMVLLWPLFIPREVVGPLGGMDWRQLSAVALGSVSWSTAAVVVISHV